MRKGEVLLLLLILAIAAGLRLYQLETIPGLHATEAARGVAILIEGTSYNVFSQLQSWSVVWYDFGLLQNWSIQLFGTTAGALRLPSVIFGVLTVLGVWLLARRLFDNRELALMAAFFVAAGFWHVAVSRVGLATVLPAFWAVWGFYEMYKGIETHRLWHWGIAGLLFGLGMYSTPTFWAVSVAALLVLAGWWWGLRVAFSHNRFAHARRQALGGVAAMFGVFILVILPLIAQRSIRPPDVPLAGQSLFFWAISAVLVAGILHVIWRIVADIRKRGYPGVPHVLLLAWLGLAFVVQDAMVLAAPAAYILAAVGLHWLAVWMRKWYVLRDKHQVCMPFERFAGRHCVGEGTLIVGIAMVAILAAMGVVETGRYFHNWAGAARIANEFPADVYPAADQINDLPPAVLKYVVTDRPEAVQYLTGTVTAEEQERMNITYLNESEFARTYIARDTVVIQLND